jgi:hypothetical protein
VWLRLGSLSLGYYNNYLVDNQSCVIVGVQATAARMSQETVAAQDMLTRFIFAADAVFPGEQSVTIGYTTKLLWLVGKRAVQKLLYAVFANDVSTPALHDS